MDKETIIVQDLLSVSLTLQDPKKPLYDLKIGIRLALKNTKNFTNTGLEQINYKSEKKSSENFLDQLWECFIFYIYFLR